MNVYERALKKLEELQSKQKTQIELEEVLEHQLVLGVIWPAAFEGGMKCSARLEGSFSDAKIILEREDGERRVFHLTVVAARGCRGRHAIYKDPSGVIPAEFIDRIQGHSLSSDDRHWIDYNRAREEDTVRMKTLRKGYFGNENSIEEGA